MITKSQIEKLKSTGIVDDIENEGMDKDLNKDRFFVHLKNGYSWDDGYGHQETKSFGGYAEAYRALKQLLCNSIKVIVS